MPVCPATWHNESSAMKALRSRALSDVLTKSDHGERKCVRERVTYYVCVCVYIYIYIYLYLCVYTYIYICTRNGSMYPYSMYIARKVLT